MEHTLQWQITNKYNRQLEYLLKDVELLSSIALLSSSSNSDPSETLTKIWKNLLLDQFHDVIPGTSIGLVYEDTKKHYSDALSSIHSLLPDFMSACASLFTTIPTISPLFTSTRTAYLAYNPSNYTQIAHLSLSSSSGYLSIPQHSFKIFSPSSLTSIHEISVTEQGENYEISTEFYLVTISNKGRILSYEDKLVSTHRRKEIIDQSMGANSLRLHDDIPDFWDAWDIFDWSRYTHKQLDANTCEVVHQNGLVQLFFEYKISEKSTMKQEVRFYSQTQRIDFRTKIQWAENRKLLRVYFPVNVMSDFVTYDIQNGILRRSSTNNTTWEQAQYEVCGHKFADLSEAGFGVAILNDSKYGYSCKGNLLGLSLLRSPKWPNETADMGEHEFTYSFFMHTGEDGLKQVQNAGFDLNAPLKIYEVPEELKMADEESYNLIEIDQSNILLDAFKMKEQSKDEIILRVHESLGYTSDCKITLNFLSKINKVIDSVVVADILENKKEDDGKNLIEFSSNDILIGLSPFKILTLKLTFKDA
jgi:alpha-mannosidase